MSNKNLLLVEGQDDKYAIAELIGHYTVWPQRKELAPVFIKQTNGVDTLLDSTFISAELKSSSLERIGIVIDADDSFQLRWQTSRNLFLKDFPSIPATLPPQGLICSDASGRRLGIWVMPDNSSNGILETFLSTLIDNSPETNQLWQHAISSTSHARTLGANYKEVHSDKAKIHSWLAWQDPPGNAFGTAILKKTLNPASGGANGFVEWFMELFQLPPLTE